MSSPVRASLAKNLGLPANLRRFRRRDTVGHRKVIRKSRVINLRSLWRVEKDRSVARKLILLYDSYKRRVQKGFAAGEDIDLLLEKVPRLRVAAMDQISPGRSPGCHGGRYA